MTTDVIAETLDRLAPEQSFGADWQDVLCRAGETASRSHLQPRRRWLLAAALLFAILSPLTAVGATENWWLFGGSEPREPLSPPEVVRTGVWDGQEWSLVAYRVENGFCFGMIPTIASQPAGSGGAAGCGGFIETLPNGTGGIGWLSGVSNRLPQYIVGPVVESADEVAIHLAGGEVLRVPAFDVPDSLGAIRFFVARVPDRTEPRGDVLFVKVEGLAADGSVVACTSDGVPC